MPPDRNAQPRMRSEEPPRRPFVREMHGYAPRQVDEQLRQLTAELREAHRRILELEHAARAVPSARIEQLLQAAQEQAAEYVRAVSSEADEIRAAARAYANEVRAAADKEMAALRAATEREQANLRAGTERELANLRATADREAAQLKTSATRERDEIITAAKREADEIRRREQFLLEQSEALRTQAEADLEVDLAARREEAERAEVERLDGVQAATRKLVAEAERRAADAEQRATAAISQADQTRRDGERDAEALFAEAREKAEQIISQARSRADQVLADGEAEAERRRAPLQRELDELTKQKNEVAEHLAQMRQLFSVVATGGDGLAD